MSQTRVRVKGRGKVPDLDGYATPQRLQHASHGATMPVAPNGEGYINQPIRSENAPNHAKPSTLDRSLDSHETQVLMRYIAASLTVNGRAKISNYEGGGAPKGKMSGGKLPFSMDEHALVSWYNQVIRLLPERSQCGLQLFYRIYLGESNGVTLDDIGRAMTRQDNKDIIKGGYITFFRIAIQDIEAAEKKAAQLRRIKRITGG